MMKIQRLFVLTISAAVLLLSPAGAQQWGGKAYSKPSASPYEPEKEPELCEAARAGDLERVRTLLEAGADVDVRGIHERTPLMYAAASGRPDVVAALLKAGADVGARDESGNTALFFPPPTDDPAVAELLLKAGTDINARNLPGQTALRGAALLGHAGLVAWLVEHGIAFQGEAGLGDLVAAVKKGHLDVARVLVKAGLALDETFEQGRTLLYLMTERDDEEAVAFLLAQKVRVDAKASCCNDATALLEAARRGNAAITRRLLDAGASAAVTDAEGFTPLLAAARAGKTETAVVLLDHGADIDDRGLEETEGTPLLWAAMEGHLELTELLLKRGAQVNARNRSGVTALMHAAFADNVELARLLLDHGAEVDASNRDGRTPLFFAVFRKHQEVAALLLERGARADVESRVEGFGRVTLLMLSAGRNHLELTRLLLDHGAPVNNFSTVETFGQATPIMLAARRGFAEIVSLLLERGADPALARRDGASALTWAQEEGHADVVALLNPSPSES